MRGARGQAALVLSATLMSTRPGSRARRLGDYFWSGPHRPDSNISLGVCRIMGCDGGMAPSTAPAQIAGMKSAFVIAALVGLSQAFEASLDPNEVLTLHADNFDDAISKNEEVLVHFHAPWSKRCDALRPHLRTIQSGADWSGRFVHAESDISDSRGYTSYLERHGVTRLPALVLFRNGHPNLYPSEEPLAVESIDAWLYRTTQDAALPRGASDDASAIKMLVRAKNSLSF